MKDTWDWGGLDIQGADQEQDRVPLQSILVRGVDVKIGDQVRLQPKGNADAFDMMLAGHIATIESIEQDYEDRILLAVTVDDDPGADLGRDRKIAHRFFFSPDEVELL